MDMLKSVLSPLTSTSSIQDTLKLVVIGGTVETARRVSVSAWNGFVDSFFLTAHFSQEDYPYDWIMHWLSKQPAWGQSREFEITTRSATRFATTKSTNEIEDEDDLDDLVHGRRKRKVAFRPSLDTTHTIYYRGHWLRVTRIKGYGYYADEESIKISVVARSNDILKKLVLEAKKEYEKDAEHRVHIYMADTTHACWRFNGARQKRPLSSIVLSPGIKDMLVADCKDFLCSEDWYAERGIPFRRGYLLHGVPGSGKTSLIHSLAGELGLDIYVVSLSAKGMSDNTLTALMGNVPSRCILLLEDLDAAFTRSVSRDASSTGVPTNGATPSGSAAANNTTTPTPPPESDGSTLSLSGLLNSLDGVAAAEGRLLFATTNHIERLDPALSRPGRMDVWINFTNATKWQAEGIYKCFFPYKSSSNTSSTEDSQDASQMNLPLPKRGSKSHNIPILTEEEIDELAKKFAQHIPEDELSVASIQGFLLKNKTRPRECVDEVAAWVVSERESREKLKKEKAEKELREKLQAEELEKKLKEELAAKEREEKEAKEKLEKKETRVKTKRSHRPAEKNKDTESSAPETPIESTSAPKSPSEISSSNESGADGDDESVTSEESSSEDKGTAPASPKVESSDKWISVKGQQNEA